VRNAEGGTEVRTGKLAGKWTLFTDVAIRKKTRGRKFGHFGDSDGFETITHSEEAINAWEDELEFARKRGTAVE
jgi:hypothetical protein